MPDKDLGPMAWHAADATVDTNVTVAHVNGKVRLTLTAAWLRTLARGFYPGCDQSAPFDLYTDLEPGVVPAVVELLDACRAEAEGRVPGRPHRLVRARDTGAAVRVYNDNPALEDGAWSESELLRYGWSCEGPLAELVCFREGVDEILALAEVGGPEIRGKILAICARLLDA